MKRLGEYEMKRKNMSPFDCLFLITFEESLSKDIVLCNFYIKCVTKKKKKTSLFLKKQLVKLF